MSCFMVKKETLSALAGWMESLINGGFNAHQMECPETLIRALQAENCADKWHFFQAEKIFSALYDLNARAVIGRYGIDNPEIVEEIYSFSPVEYEENYKHKMMEWGKGHVVIRQWHYEMLKRLDCFVYQCDEDANRDNDLLRGLIDLKHIFAGHIARNCGFYKNAKWG